MKKFFNFVIKISSILIFIILLISSIFTIKAIKSAPDMDYNNLNLTDNTKIYDSNSILISSKGTKVNTYVPISKISNHMINAIVSVEDKSFYTHNGINVSRMISSTISNLKNLNYSQGASTITQQLVKNIYLNSDKTISRKITEISMAIKLDKDLTKNQIMEAYLNNILFSGNIYGIEAASINFFHKNSSDLTIEDAALLAGMVQLPNYYNPFKNPEKALERRNLVINLMLENKYITELEANNAKSIPIKNQLNKGNISIHEDYSTAYLNYLNEYMTENDLNSKSKNTSITTTMNSSIQREIYKIMQNDYGYFSDDDLKCAIVVIDNKTNSLLGISGNRNNNSLVFNYATSLIQPGSTIKPILDYAPAIEYLNLSPASIILDEPYTYSNGFNINNWDHQYKGYITIRKALSESRNVPAVKLFQQIGKDKALDFAANIGIKPVSEVYESEAIGGSTYGYSLLSLTNAYTAFANMGKYKDSTPIKKLNNKDYLNNVPYKTVMKETTAFLINDMLHDVFKNSSFDLNNTYLMAKTGQTNYDASIKEKYKMPYDAVKDSLVIAYTKDITVGIWVSYNSNSKYLTSTTKNIPRTIMKHLMNSFAKDNQYYDMPNGLKYIKVTQDNDKLYLANSNDLNNSFYDYFIVGTEPLDYKPKNSYIKI